jgi:hypothetical protein
MRGGGAMIALGRALRPIAPRAPAGVWLAGGGGIGRADAVGLGAGSGALRRTSAECGNGSAAMPPARPRTSAMITQMQQRHHAAHCQVAAPAGIALAAQGIGANRGRGHGAGIIPRL